MLIYFVCLFVVMGASLYIPPQDQQKRKSLFFFVVMFVGLICGLRDMLGGFDNYIYGEIFDVTARELKGGTSVVNTTAYSLNTSELGYAFWNIGLGYVFRNRYLYFLTTSVVMYLILYRHFTKYSKYPFVAFFILFGIWYFFSYTYLRQVFAALIAWFAIPYAIDRKPVKFFLIVVLAASFHNSALLFGLLYFIAHYRFSRRTIILFFVVSLFLGFTPLGVILMDFFGSGINERKTDISLSGVGSARIEYILESLFFMSIIVYDYGKIPKDKYSLCFLNISLLFLFILTFFVQFSDGGRMSWFFLIGIACTISNILVRDVQKPLIRIMLYVVMLLLYIRIVFAWGDLLSPYKTFLTNGVRSNDRIWEKYEYDQNYAKDKFYNMK